MITLWSWSCRQSISRQSAPQQQSGKRRAQRRAHLSQTQQASLTYRQAVTKFTRQEKHPHHLRTMHLSMYK
jgi:hypothetical protein